MSASRRTDIPAFYMDWFLEQIRLGFFNIKNPYTKTIKKLDLSKENIHSIVFWSKNYDIFINTCAGERLQKLGFNLYFNFTINSDSDLLEPNLPPLKKRLEQLDLLASRFGPETIAWRFDPICFFRTKANGPMQNNLGDFNIIAKAVQKTGIKKCVTSFCDSYAKIQKRVRFLFKENNQTFLFTDPSFDQKKHIIHQMENDLKKKKIQLYLCCEKQVFSSLDTDSSVLKNACINGNELRNIFGGKPEIRRDYGQRSKKGCQCTRSIDVGSYEDHPCFHNCLFCYANPDIDSTIKKMKLK